MPRGHNDRRDGKCRASGGPKREILGGRRRFFLLVAILLAIVLTVSGISLGTLYQMAFDQQRKGLIQTAQSQARLMEEVARFDSRFSGYDHPEGADDL